MIIVAAEATRFHSLQMKCAILPLWAYFDTATKAADRGSVSRGSVAVSSAPFRFGHHELEWSLVASAARII